MSDQSVISVRGLAKTFPIKGSDAIVNAVADVSFEVMHRETLGLVGESGSGKTTVGRCLLKLETSSGGTISFRDIDVTHLSASAFRPFRQKMQMVFQEPHPSLNPKYTAFSTISEPLMIAGERDRRKLRAKTEEICRLVKLNISKLDTYPHQMSSGELQRVAIARAIATSPDFVVLDEPTSMLDLSVRGEIIELLIELQRKTGISYLFISHDLTTVESLCHRVAVMYLGQIVEIGPVDVVFGAPKHPYSRALLASALAPDPNVKPTRYVLSGEIPNAVDVPKGCKLAPRCPEVTPRCWNEPQDLVNIGNDAGSAVRCWRAVEAMTNGASTGNKPLSLNKL